MADAEAAAHDERPRACSDERYATPNSPCCVQLEMTSCDQTIDISSHPHGGARGGDGGGGWAGGAGGGVGGGEGGAGGWGSWPVQSPEAQLQLPSGQASPEK